MISVPWTISLTSLVTVLGGVLSAVPSFPGFSSAIEKPTKTVRRNENTDRIESFFCMIASRRRIHRTYIISLRFYSGIGTWSTTRGGECFLPFLMLWAQLSV